MRWTCFHLVFTRTIKLGDTPWRSIDELLKTYWRCLEDIFARRLEDVLTRHLENVLSTSWRLMTMMYDLCLRRIYLSWLTHLKEVLKTSSKPENEWRRPDVFKMSSLRQIFAGKKHVYSNHENKFHSHLLFYNPRKFNKANYAKTWIRKKKSSWELI